MKKRPILDRVVDTVEALTGAGVEKDQQILDAMEERTEKVKHGARNAKRGVEHLRKETADGVDLEVDAGGKTLTLKSPKIFDELKLKTAGGEELAGRVEALDEELGLYTINLEGLVGDEGDETIFRLSGLGAEQSWRFDISLDGDGASVESFDGYSFPGGEWGPTYYYGWDLGPEGELAEKGRIDVADLGGKETEAMYEFTTSEDGSLLHAYAEDPGMEEFNLGVVEKGVELDE